MTIDEIRKQLLFHETSKKIDLQLFITKLTEKNI